MALVPATLGAGLGAMAPTDNEAVGTSAFVSAWESYFSTAMAGPIPAVPGSLSGALSSLRGALTGMSGSGQASAKIQAGIVSFWGTVAGSAATIWPPAISATPPPGLGGIAASLSGVFSANMSAGLALAAAANNIATALHATQSGGIAVFPPPPGGIGPQAIT